MTYKRAGRWVLRFAAITLLAGMGILRAGPAPPLRIHPEISPDRVRLELAASGPFEFSTSRPSQDLYVVELAGLAPVEQEQAQTLDSDLVRGYRLYETSTEGHAEVRFEVLLSPAARPRVERVDNRIIRIVVARGYSSAEEGTSPAALAEKSASAVSQAAASPAAGLTANLAPAVAGAPSESGATAAMKAPRPAAVELSAAPQAATYSGEPISVNLKDVDLADFFRLIHEISGLNVVIDPNVKGTVTLVLDNVPWDQALDIVLQNNDLEKHLEGNVLRIATKETLKKEALDGLDLAKAQSDAVGTVTVARTLNYAKSDDLVVTLRKFLSPHGDLFSDSRSNAIIIRDIQSVIPVMDKVIQQVDRKSQQVEIEARVVAANRTFSREIGTMFGFAAANKSRSNFLGGLDSVGNSPLLRGLLPPFPIPPLVSTSTGTAPSGSGLPLNTNLGAAVPTSGIGYQFSSANFALDLIISAAETKGVGKLLSKPRVATQNNTKATVKQGVKIPIQTIVNNTISVQYVDAVLELEVTPQITPEGTVFMDVHVENTQIDPSIPRVQGIPALDTESADTHVLVQDGSTVVVGGIIISSQQSQTDQVPLLGSIPVIGNLFKHTIINNNSQELLFFLTPRILPS
jgi:type IV pilus secretin PilQ/predicted competence protein